MQSALSNNHACCCASFHSCFIKVAFMSTYQEPIARDKIDDGCRSHFGRRLLQPLWTRAAAATIFCCLEQAHVVVQACNGCGQSLGRSGFWSAGGILCEVLPVCRGPGPCRLLAFPILQLHGQGALQVSPTGYFLFSLQTFGA